MTSLELVDFINQLRADEGGYTPLRHDNFMAKVPRVIGESMSPKFLGVINQTMPQGGSKQREIYRFPKREATLMAMSYSHEISAQVYDKMEALDEEKFPCPLFRCRS